MNNSTDVPLLTKMGFERLLYATNHIPNLGDVQAALIAGSLGHAITKSAAAEEADRARIVALEAEVARCHERLEIVHRFRGSPPVGEVIPINERATWPDAVRVRNETIALQDARIAELVARLQSGGYCAFCETTVAPLPGFLLSHVMRGHVEMCEKHPLAAARAVLERLAKYPESPADEMSASTMRAIARQALSGGSENG